jgi:hypothetical protein
MTSDNASNIVYGAVHHRGAVFLLKQRAHELAMIHELLTSCSTWADFKARAPVDLYEEYREKSGVDELTSFDEFYAEELKSRPSLSREEAREEYAALSQDERQALPTDPFPGHAIGPICDGDWPGFPEQEMLKWMPQDIQQGSGVIRSSVLNGDFLTFLADIEDVADALRNHGFTCTRDDALVARACGYHSS